MERISQQFFLGNLTWEHRAHLSTWTVRELWILCKERLRALLLQRKISPEKYRKLIKKFKSLFEDASTREIKTSTDILLIESDIRLITYMLQEIGIDAIQELLKSVTKNHTTFLFNR